MSIEPTVFLVDDEPAVRNALSVSLEVRGFSVECFESAETFLETYHDARPGCLVLDIRMAGMSGLELQAELTERQLKIPIIFITGHGDIPQSVQAIKAGAVDFLEKPYRKEILLERISEALAEDARSRQDDAEREAIVARHARLSGRERQVMALLVEGAANKSSKQVAEELQISRRTVDHYRANVMEKMQARSLPELVIMGRLCGASPPED